MPLSQQEIETFLAEPHVAVIATVDDHGRPHVTPVWFLWEDGAATLFTGRASRKWRNLLRNPHAALCIDDREVPYRSVIIEGTVEEIRGRALYDPVRRMALAYYGPEKGEAFAETYRRDRPGTVLFRLVPDRLISQLSD